MNRKIFLIAMVIGMGCNIPQHTLTNSMSPLPGNFPASDTTSSVLPGWRNYFTDPNLISLIDTALLHNQELNIVMQEIEISKNEIRARKGEYLPFVGLRGGIGLDRIPEYTWRGAVEQNLDVKTKEDVFKSKTDLAIGAVTSWEIDIWRKLRNAKNAAVSRYLATTEGKNFLVTNLVAEIASSYYELQILDNQLEIINQNIALQTTALKGVKIQKEAARLSQLAVNRFEAQLLNTTNFQFAIRQQIVETENRINFLLGRSAQSIPRSPITAAENQMGPILPGSPSQLLVNRPDIRQAEQELAATKLDVLSARANFKPALRLDNFLGFNAYNLGFLFNPGSLLYSIAADLAGPLVNRNNIKAMYMNANASQQQALTNYEQRILNAYLEVVNQLSNTQNLKMSFDTKSKEVDILNASIGISNNLFQYARADYIEVLLTQEEALKSRLELTEIQLGQMHARVQLYRALGGGWR